MMEWVRKHSFLFSGFASSVIAASVGITAILVTVLDDNGESRPSDTPTPSVARITETPSPTPTPTPTVTVPPTPTLQTMMTVGLSDTTPGEPADMTLTIDLSHDEAQWTQMAVILPEGAELGMGVPIAVGDALQTDVMVGQANVTGTFSLHGGACNSTRNYRFEEILNKSRVSPLEWLQPSMKDSEGNVLSPHAWYQFNTNIAGAPTDDERIDIAILIYAAEILASAYPDRHSYDSIGKEHTGQFVMLVFLTKPVKPTTDQIPGRITGSCTPESMEIELFGIARERGTGVLLEDQIRYRNPANDDEYVFTTWIQTHRDADGDGVENELDTCPFAMNGGDTDGDGIDNACQPAGSQSEDPDDGIPPLGDNCPLVYNPEQEDQGEIEAGYVVATDGDGGPWRDGIGDACDPNPQRADGGYDPICFATSIGTGGSGEANQEADQVDCVEAGLPGS